MLCSRELLTVLFLGQVFPQILLSAFLSFLICGRPPASDTNISSHHLLLRALEAGNAYLRLIKNRRHCDAFLPTVNRLFFFLFSIFSLCLFRQFFFNRIRQTAKRITTRGIPKHFYSRFCMLFKLMASVDVLCSIAEVVGIKTPVTPSAIRAELNPTMKR